MTTLDVLGIDIGASNGRGYLGSFDGETLSLREIHSFPNGPVDIHIGSYWDILSLFDEIRNCFLKTRAESIKIGSLGIDGWAQDFGLLDAQGNLLGNPHTYRDSRTDHIMEEVGDRITEQEIFRMTGMHPFPFCTLFQLISMKTQEKAMLERANRLLFIPNLLSYFITGNLNCDSTLASVSLLYSPFARRWLDDFLNRFGIPAILPDIREGCGVIGNTSDGFLQDTGITKIPVISVIQHDTASSVFAAPIENMEDTIFISSGTWSVLGTMVSEPIISDEVFNSGFCNELTYDHRTMLLQNITGLWILQECAREWSLEGYEIDYGYMEEKAKSSEFCSFIDPDDEGFSKAGNMTSKVIRYCLETKQPAPESKEQIYQCIVHGLARKYAQSIKELERLLNKEFHHIYIFGGGARSHYLCSQTARLTGIEVLAGASQATVIGNIISQLMVLGEIQDRVEAVEVIRKSFPLERSRST